MAAEGYGAGPVIVRGGLALGDLNVEDLATGPSRGSSRARITLTFGL
jgi:hypothetical protein